MTPYEAEYRTPSEGPDRSVGIISSEEKKVLDAKRENKLKCLSITSNIKNPFALTRGRKGGNMPEEDVVKPADDDQDQSVDPAAPVSDHDEDEGAPEAEGGEEAAEGAGEGVVKPEGGDEEEKEEDAE